MTEKLILMLSKKTKANWSDIFVLKATENMYFWSPDLLALVIILLICLAPQNTRNHKYSSLHLSSLYMPSALHVTSNNYGQISQKIFQTAQQVGHTGFFLTQPSSSPPSPPAPLMMKHTTPLMVLIVCAFPFHYCWRLNRPLVWEDQQWSSFDGIIYNRKKSFKKRKQERQWQQEVWLWSHSFMRSLAPSVPFPGHLPSSSLLESGPWVLFQFLHDATVLRLCGVTHFRNENTLRYINSSDFFDQVTPGHPFPWPTFSDE